MGKLNFVKYQRLFESEVISKGVTSGVIGKSALVNVRKGKLAYTKYAEYLGAIVDSETQFVIDYYGYLKWSKGFLKLIRDNEEATKQIKSIQSTVVYFASIKIEVIAELTSNQYLRGGFSEFKKEILYWRGFENRKKTPRESIVEGTDRRVAV
jgi:hypothetical protein